MSDARQSCRRRCARCCAATTRSACWARAAPARPPSPPASGRSSPRCARKTGWWPSTPTPRSANSAAGQTMDGLADNGYTGLLHRTVVVLNDSDGHADAKTRATLTEYFSRHGQVVIELPFDGHLRPGGVIDIDNELNRPTRRRLLE